jgi:hypothetical protein
LSLNRVPKEYKISKALIIGGGVFAIGVLLMAFFGDMTFTELYMGLSTFIGSDKAVFFMIILLSLIAITHSVFRSLRLNIDEYDSNSIFSLNIWIISIFTLLGIGFMGYSALKVFCGLLGEKVCKIPFLVKPDDLTLWPFMALSIFIIVYCGIRVGIFIGEIVTAVKSFL